MPPLPDMTAWRPYLSCNVPPPPPPPCVTCQCVTCQFKILLKIIATCQIQIPLMPPLPDMTAWRPYLSCNIPPPPPLSAHQSLNALDRQNTQRWQHICRTRYNRRHLRPWPWCLFTLPWCLSKITFTKLPCALLCYAIDGLWFKLFWLGCPFLALPWCPGKYLPFGLAPFCSYFEPCICILTYREVIITYRINVTNNVRRNATYKISM